MMSPYSPSLDVVDLFAATKQRLLSGLHTPDPLEVGL
jgi:hypothetical protein